MMVNLTLIIVDFLKAEKVCQNINLLLQQEGDFQADIKIIDNSENSQNAETLTQHIQKLKQQKKIPKNFSLSLKISPQNIGYIQANNQAAKNNKSKYLFFINPDIFCPEKDTFQKMIHYLDRRPHIAILGPKQIIRGTRQTEIVARPFPNLLAQIIKRTRARHWHIFRKIIDREEQTEINHHKTQKVDWLQSSFMVVRQDFWQKVGGFSPHFFLFMADVEICYQAWKHNLQVIYFTENFVTADGLRCSEGGIRNFFRKKILRLHTYESLKYQLMHLLEKNPRR
jgi:N-acetylglucosaminyl-diphospho-decaprenol L-rhamnosyltransferase